MEVTQLMRVLDFENCQFAFLALSENIHTIKLVVLCILVGFALQETFDGEFLIQKRTHQALQHGMICLVAEQTLHGPVKSDVICHNILI